MFILKSRNYLGTDLINIIPNIKEAVKKIKGP